MSSFTLSVIAVSLAVGNFVGLGVAGYLAFAKMDALESFLTRLEIFYRDILKRCKSVEAAVAEYDTLFDQQSTEWIERLEVHKRETEGAHRAIRKLIDDQICDSIAKVSNRLEGKLDVETAKDLQRQISEDVRGCLSGFDEKLNNLREICENDDYVSRSELSHRLKSESESVRQEVLEIIDRDLEALRRDHDASMRQVLRLAETKAETKPEAKVEPPPAQDVVKDLIDKVGKSVSEISLWDCLDKVINDSRKRSN